jgi:hypothetical protein
MQKQLEIRQIEPHRHPRVRAATVRDLVWLGKTSSESSNRKERIER